MKVNLLEDDVIMTRWARSKGSAASNERVEEEATPWSQLVSGVRQEQHHNVEDLEEFEEEDTGAEEQVAHESKLKPAPLEEEEPESDEDNLPSNLPGEEKADDDKPKVLIEQNEEDVGKKKKKKRNQNKCLNCKQEGHLKKECPDLSEERRKELQDLYTMKIERKGHGTGRKKNKNKNKNKSENGDATNGEPSGQDVKKETSNEGAGVKKKQSDDGDSEAPPAKKSKVDKKPFDKKPFDQKPFDQNNKQFEKKKFDKKAKKPRVDLTGQTVQDDEGLFQGFRVKKEAVKKLKAMVAQLKSEDRSEEEMAETIKRERRKAERELAKFRKTLCFNCRQTGHLLIDCPENKEGATTKQKVNRFIH